MEALGIGYLNAINAKSRLQGMNKMEERSLQRIKGEDVKRCPECGNGDLVREQGELYCKKCGFVIE